MPTLNIGAMLVCGIALMLEFSTGAMPALNIGAMLVCGIGIMLTISTGAMPVFKIGEMAESSIGIILALSTGAISVFGIGAMADYDIGVTLAAVAMVFSEYRRNVGIRYWHYNDIQYRRNIVLRYWRDSSNRYNGCQYPPRIDWRYHFGAAPTVDCRRSNNGLPWLAQYRPGCQFLTGVIQN